MLTGTRAHALSNQRYGCAGSQWSSQSPTTEGSASTACVDQCSLSAKCTQCMAVQEALLGKSIHVVKRTACCARCSLFKLSKRGSHNRLLVTYMTSVICLLHMTLTSVLSAKVNAAILGELPSKLLALPTQASKLSKQIGIEYALSILGILLAHAAHVL